MTETTQETRTEAQHTPAPWTAGERDGRGWIPVGRPGQTLAEVFCFNAAPDAEGRANARLIAAAPDLLAALVVMLKGDELGEYECQRQGFARLSERWEMARAAIAKAEGR